MLLSHLVRGGEDALERLPAADRRDEALVLHLAPIADLAGLRGAEPALRQEAAAERAVGQQLDVVRQAEFAHRLAGAAIKKREADLVRDDADAVLDENAQMVGVEIGEAEVTDATFLLQRGELGHGIE